MASSEVHTETRKLLKKKLRLVVDKLKKSRKSLRIRNTLICSFGISAPQLSSEYTVGEVKFRALIEDGNDMRMSNDGGKQIPNLMIQSNVYLSNFRITYEISGFSY